MQRKKSSPEKEGFFVALESTTGFSAALAWDCKGAPAGVGSPAPEHRSKQRIKPSARFGSSVTLDFTDILQDALENFPFFRYDRDNTMERWGKTQKWKKPLSLPFFHPQKAGTCAWLLALLKGPVWPVGSCKLSTGCMQPLAKTRKSGFRHFFDTPGCPLGDSPSMINSSESRPG